MTDALLSNISGEQGWATARTLAEALPFIQRYDRTIVVIKYGGHAMGEEATARQFAADVVLLKLLGMHPVVVHGGGPQISRMLERAGVTSSFVDGLRVTDAATMEVAEMVLSGAVNKEIANWITLAGREADVRGVGLSGKDARLITVTKATRTKKDPGSELEKVVDLGLVGEPTHVDPQLLLALIHAEQDYVPVIAPIGVSESGETYNINADLVAGKVAEVLKAEKLVLLTNTVGVLDKNGNLLTGLTAKRIDELFADGTISGGMLPKISSALDAAKAGVNSVHIIDGRVDHSLLLEIMTDQGVGTMIRSH